MSTYPEPVATRLAIDTNTFDHLSRKGSQDALDPDRGYCLDYNRGLMKGRGAIDNPTGRFEPYVIEADFTETLLCA